MTIDTAILVELITAIPYYFSTVYMITNFTDALRIRSKKTSYTLGVAILYLSAIYNLVINAYSPQNDITPYIVGIGAYIATVFMINKDGLKRKILILVWCVIPTVFIEIFMEIWLYFFVTHDIDGLLLNPITNIYTRMFSSTFTICLNVCIVLFLNRKKYHGTTLSIVFLALFPITQAMYLTLILAPSKASTLNPVLIVNAAFEIVFTIMYFLYVYFISITNRVYQERQEQILLSEIKNKDRQYYDMVQEDIKHMQFVRHDMRNFIDQLSYLINEDSTESKNKARDLLSQIDGKITNYSSEKYCEHQVANMVLTIAKNKAIINGVNLKISANIPSDINIDDIDISSVISNLTENAINETSSVTENKTAEFSIAIVNGYLVVKTINPTNIETNITDINKLKTTKDDKTSHGFGLKILKEIADKYNGELTVEIIDKICTFAMILKV